MGNEDFDDEGHDDLRSESVVPGCREVIVPALQDVLGVFQSKVGKVVVYADEDEDGAQVDILD